jgi:hypothetical protein
MRDFCFFTKNKIIIDDCLEALKSEVKNIETNNDGEIWVNGKWMSCFHVFNEGWEDFYFIDEEHESEFKGAIPFEDPFVNDFETHRSIDLKRFITALLKVYPELYVYSDEDDFIGSGREFLEREFDY